MGSLKESIIRLLFTVNQTGFLVVATIIIILDLALSLLIVHKVKYTEIDWSTYMQQVECYTKQRILNYSLIGGDTGPIVYPAGHLMVYRILYTLTNAGKNIRIAQHIFVFFYIVNLLLVTRLYYKSNRIAPFVLLFVSLTGHRVHSIFMLRLFNDPIAMMFFYMAANLFISQQWLLGSIMYSFAVSIKMNVLLFAPALFFVYLLNTGLERTVGYLLVCALVQIWVAWPFLGHDPVSYMTKAFELSRVFLHEWTVNWRFVPEHIFIDKRLHIGLLFLHLMFLAAFAYYMWFRSHGGLKATLVELYHGIRCRTGVAETLFALFTANLIGITFSRSLHYQFYSWYFHQLPFLLFWNPDYNAESVPWSTIGYRVLVLLVTEWCWNVFPSTPLSSFVLHLVHLQILVFLIRTRVARKTRTGKAKLKTQ